MITAAASTRWTTGGAGDNGGVTKLGLMDGNTSGLARVSSYTWVSM